MCICLDAQCRPDAFETTRVDLYRTEGWLHTIDLCRCAQCGRLWLRYSLDHEASTGWGRWYRGLVAAEAAESLTPESAGALFGRLEWHFYGGPYYRTSGERSYGPVHVAAPSALAGAA